MREVRLSPDLPEHLARLYNPKLKLFATPLDARGIADVDAVFELAIRTYPDDLPDFGTAFRDRHHLYWTEEWWEDYAASQVRPKDTLTVTEFRNAAPQIAFIPRVIHKWIEHSQIKPPPPTLEVMEQRNISWQLASLLLESVVKVERARTDYEENKDVITLTLGCIKGITPKSKQREEPFVSRVDEPYWRSEYESRLKGWQALVSLHSDLPQEHRLLPRTRIRHVRASRRRFSTEHNATIPAFPQYLVAA